ncbi:MAG: hypothetical protein E7J22_00790 [Clostridium perfringens]|nr:hypothetical protein [Clostridium perfringens]MDU7962860.1 hypothetical protein [Clostridium perfringens]
MQKYSCECGLGVYCSYKTLIPVEYLDLLSKNNSRYHIYMILSTPKISVKDISKSDNGINFTLIRHLGEKDEKFIFKDIDIIGNIIGMNIDLGMNIDYSKVEIRSQYPYNSINIKINKEYLKKFYNEQIKNNIKLNKSQIMNLVNLKIDTQELFDMNYKYIDNNYEMEVLYVGQAYGENGKRTAIERLKSHEKLQKILIDCNATYPHKRIYVLLLEMSSQIFSNFNGISSEFICSEEESFEHFNRVMSTLPKENQIINITEAAIINYFKPKYNVNFIDNFPSVKHKGYSQYYDLDYNCITVELDMEFKGLPYLQLYSKEKRINNPFEFISYDLFNDPNRSNMYDIFKTK